MTTSIRKARCIALLAACLTVGHSVSAQALERSDGPATGVTGATFHTIHYARDSPLQAADIYPSSAATPASVVILIHVGGWASGGRASVSPVARDLADNGFVVVNANYRLDSPTTAAFPMEVDDIRSLIHWTQAHIGEYGGDRKKITLVGGSAGGHLAMMAGLLEAKEAAGSINGVVSLSGPSDLTNLRAQFSLPPIRKKMIAALDQALGNCTANPCALAKPYSPALNVDASRCPPMLLFNEDNELLPATQAQEMAMKLRANGCRVQLQILPGRLHAFDYWSSVSAKVIAWIMNIDGSSVSSSSISPVKEDGSPKASRQISARQPRGIYGVVLDRRQFPLDHRPYTASIDNPAIAGLFLYFDWATLEPKEGEFDFSLVEEAFKIADSTHKTLQFALLPGFSTPPWLMERLPSCDDWLASRGKTGVPPPRCGKATFGFPEGVARKGEMHELPLPWNPVYKRDWHAFLVEFARRFGQREAFVSIAIAGPTSQSEEIIMPHNGPGETEKWAQLLEAFYRDPSYHRSNKAFVEEWKLAIDDYGRIFSNVTLALTLAAGLPFNPTGAGQQEVSTLEITAYFASRPLGPNAKATQNNGVMAAHPLTMRPVKAMAADARLNPRVLAGGEFSTGYARDPAREGCPSDDRSSPACQSITPEQALGNVLGVFFAGTPYGHFYGSANGIAPIQYLQIYQDDILYANDHPVAQAKLLEASKRLMSSH
jgi:acetyl esterase/lipase